VVVAFGEGELPGRGTFRLTLATGLELEGFAVGEGEVVNLRATVRGRPLALPSWALLFLSRDLRSVAGGPADPGAWDRWFGELSSFTAGDGEARARAHKAASLPAPLAAIYAEVRRVRERGDASAAKVHALREAAAAFPDEWLLRAELDELGEQATDHGLQDTGQRNGGAALP
jgi:phenylalanine-4-hydroxylase